MFQINNCQDLLTVFDTYDQGLSQTRGLTLYELAKAQLEKFTYFSEKKLRETSLKNEESKICSSEERNGLIRNEGLILLREIKKNIEEAILCLLHEIPDSHGGKTRKKLLDMKQQLLNYRI